MFQSPSVVQTSYVSFSPWVYKEKLQSTGNLGAGHFPSAAFSQELGRWKEGVKTMEVFPLTSGRPYLFLSPLLQPLPDRAFTAAVFCLQQGWKRNSSSLKKLESNSVSVKSLGTPILFQIRFRIKLDAFQPTLLPGAKQWQRKFFNIHVWLLFHLDILWVFTVRSNFFVLVTVWRDKNVPIQQVLL